MTKALITGSGGLVGSECVALLCELGWDVIGLDNNLRGHHFLGQAGTVAPTISRLCERHRRYSHHEMDIRNREAIRDLFKRNGRTSSFTRPLSHRTTRPARSPMRISMSMRSAI